MPFLTILSKLVFRIFTRIFEDRIVTQRQLHGRPLTPNNRLLDIKMGAPDISCGLQWFAWNTLPHVLNLP